MLLLFLTFVGGFHRKSKSWNDIEASVPKRPVTTYTKGPQSDDNQDFIVLAATLERISPSPNANIEANVMFIEHL